MPDHLITVRVKPDLLKKLTAWRRDQPDLPSEPEAIRRMIEHATGRSDGLMRTIAAYLSETNDASGQAARKIVSLIYQSPSTKKGKRK